MDFFEHLHKFMTGNVKLKDVFANRIYPVNMPQKPTYPAVVYFPINTSYDKNLIAESGYVRQKVQFSVYDKTFGKVRKASRIIREEFKDFSNSLAGLRIEATHSLTDFISKTNTAENFSTEEFCAILEFEYQYEEEQMAIAGKNGKISIGSTNPVKVVGIKNWSLDLSLDTLDTTCLGDDWKNYTTGLKEWSASGDGDYVVPTDAEGQAALQEAFLSGDQVTVKLFVDGKNCYTGTAFISSLSIEDPVDDVVSISIEFTGTGELTFEKGE